MWRFRLSIFVLLSATCAVSGQEAQDETLRSIDAIHDLPAERLGDRIPVEFVAQVAYYSSEWPILFLHDGQTGMYSASTSHFDIRTGQSVLVRGFVGPGRYIVDPTFSSTQETVSLPSPLTPHYDVLRAARLDSQYVELEGALTQVEQRHSHFFLEITVDDERRFNLLLPEASVSLETLAPWLGHRLKTRGVVGAVVNSTGRFQGFQLWGSGPESATLLHRADDVEIDRLAVIDLSSLEKQEMQLRRITGRIVSVSSDRKAFIADETGVVFARSASAQDLRVNDAVDVTGYVRFDGLTPQLYGAVFERTEKDLPPSVEAKVTTGHRILNEENFDSHLIKIEGIVIATVEEGGPWILQSGSTVFTTSATMGDDVRLENGTTVSVTGVCIEHEVAGVPQGTFEVFAVEGGIEVLSPPMSWWLIASFGVLILSWFAFAVWRRALKIELARGEARIRAGFIERERVEQRYAQLISNARDIVLSADLDGHVRSINPQGTSLLGLAEADVIGQRLEEFVSPATRPRLEGLLAARDAPESASVHSIEIEIVDTRGQTVPLEVNAWLDVEHGKACGFQAIARDVSERRRFQEKILLAQKTESLAILAGGVAHDFNNILQGIIGNASLALTSVEDKSLAGTSLHRIENAVSRASDLTQQLLAYAGRGSLKEEVLDISPIVADTVALVRPSVARTVEFDVDVPRELPRIKGDATQVGQIILNLLVNAGESYGERAGKVHVSIGEKKLSSDDLAEYRCSDELSEGQHVLIVVEDEGKGMDAETLSRIFDPFFSTKFAGRGLGLAAVQGIIRKHRGGIQVHSAIGQGSRFEVVIPVTEEPLPERPRAPESGAHNWTADGTVLVIDDEAEIRRFLRMGLEGRGLEILEAEDGLRGIEVFTENSDTIDLVLLDLAMPGVGGLEVLARLREIRSDVEVVICSGYQEDDMQQEAELANPPTAFLSKPYRLSQLSDIVRSVLRARREKTDRTT